MGRGLTLEVVRGNIIKPLGLPAATRCAYAGISVILRGDFKAFRLTRATRRTDGRPKVDSSTPNFTPSILYAFRNMNAPQGRVPWTILRNFQFCGRLHTGLGVKILADSLKRLQSYGGLNLGGAFSQAFSAPLAVNIFVGWENVLEVQERYGLPPPLSPCQVLWGQSSRAVEGEGAKSSMFFGLQLCPLRFWMTKFVNANSPSTRWNIETILASLESGMFVGQAVHPRSTFSLQRWAEPPPWPWSTFFVLTSH